MDQKICKIINEFVFFKKINVFLLTYNTYNIHISTFYAVELNLVLLVSITNYYTSSTDVLINLLVYN